MLAVPKTKNIPNSKDAVAEGSVNGTDAAAASVPTPKDDASDEDPPIRSHDSSLSNAKTRERLEEEDAANQTKKRKTKDDATAEATSSCSEDPLQQEDERETNKDDEQGLLAASAEGGPGKFLLLRGIFFLSYPTSNPILFLKRKILKHRTRCLLRHAGPRRSPGHARRPPRCRCCCPSGKQFLHHDEWFPLHDVPFQQQQQQLHAATTSAFTISTDITGAASFE